MIRLSVIVPFYGVEAYIEDCIRSLYRQDIPLEEYEVICVDDCSPDKSAEIVERLQKEFLNLRLIRHTQNMRLGGARNTGLKEAKGEYIWFVDSDDYVWDNSYGTLLKEAETNRLDVLHFNFVEDRQGKMVKSYPNLGESPIQTGGDCFFGGDGEWHINYVVAWQKIYRREFLIENQIFFQEHVMFEDNEYAFRVFSVAKRVKHIDVAGYVYRQNSASVTRERFKVQHLIWLTDTCLSVTKLIPTLAIRETRFSDAAKKYVRDMVYKVNWYIARISAKERKQMREYLTIGKYIRVIKYVSLRWRWELFKNLYLRK